jgi:hypothetical protein
MQVDENGGGGDFENVIDIVLSAHHVQPRKSFKPVQFIIPGVVYCGTFFITRTFLW